MPPKTQLQKVLDKPNPTVAEVEAALGTVPNLNEPYVKTAKTTYLMKAARFVRDVNILRLLVERGADITLKDKDGLNALHHAVSFRPTNISNRHIK
jgi:ankyrin repeat protein